MAHAGKPGKNNSPDTLVIFIFDGEFRPARAEMSFRQKCFCGERSETH